MAPPRFKRLKGKQIKCLMVRCLALSGSSNCLCDLASRLSPCLQLLFVSAMKELHGTAWCISVYLGGSPGAVLLEINAISEYHHLLMR